MCTLSTSFIVTVFPVSSGSLNLWGCDKWLVGLLNLFVDGPLKPSKRHRLPSVDLLGLKRLGSTVK